MSCTKISYNKHSRAWHHFYDRFEVRGVHKIISLKELEEIVTQYYVSRKICEDKKHPGIQGPRYRIRISRNNKVITVIIEKTKNCLLPITIWFENLR